MTKLAERTKLIKPSVTLAIAAKAGKLRSEGIDVVNFSAGEPDFDTPDHIKAAAVEALRKGMTKYTDVKGIEPLRAAIVHKYEHEHGLAYRKDDVLVSCGAKHSLYNVFQAVVNSGDEILIPAPYWVSYSDMALLAGGIPKMIQTNEASGFRITAEQLAAELTPKTKVFVLNSPCNPTGASYAADELLAIARVLEKHNCLVIVDDIYEKIVYDNFQVHNIVALEPGAARPNRHHQRRFKNLRNDGLAHRLCNRSGRYHFRRRQDSESKHVQPDVDCSSSSARSYFWLTS